MAEFRCHDQAIELAKLSLVLQEASMRKRGESILKLRKRGMVYICTSWQLSLVRGCKHKA